MNEFDKADFQGIYSGKTLMEGVKIKQIPWDIGRGQEVVKEAVEGVRIGELLDVGCGTGENAEYIAAKGVLVTAVDFSKDAITEARKRHQESEVVYKHQDIFQVEDSWIENFDVVLDSATYHAIPSESRLDYLKILYSYLRSSGKLITITFANHPRGMPRNLAVEKESLHNNLRKAGFDNISIKLGFYHGIYSAIDGFVEKYNLNIDTNQDGESILPVWVAKSSKR